MSTDVRPGLPGLRERLALSAVTAPARLVPGGLILTLGRGFGPAQGIRCGNGTLNGTGNGTGKTRRDMNAGRLAQRRQGLRRLER